MTEKLHVLIAGGSGPLGKSIAAQLLKKNHEVRFLSVSKEDPSRNIYRWNPEAGIFNETAMEGIDVVINLSGAGVAEKRWTPTRKKTISDSRIMSTRLLAEYILSHPEKNIRLISASAIGIYPAKDPHVKNETDAAGDGFLAKVCKDWEAEAQKAKDVSIVRIGVVLSKQGGFLEKMRPLARFHLLSPLGTGKQMISWIHEEDVANIFSALAEGSLPTGTYNAVAPHPVSNEVLLKTYAELSHSGWWAPSVPAFLIKLLFGQMADETIFSDQNIAPKNLLEAGFEFQYPAIQKALASIIS